MTLPCSWILTYHSLDTSGSVISLDPKLFRDQMEWLRGTGIEVVPLERVKERPGAVAITFDDGFRNFYEDAFPVLQDHRFPATVFIVTDFCGRQNNWPSQPASPPVPRLPLMNWSELREIAAAGISLGSHTVTHPRMTGLSEKQIEEELRISQISLEDGAGQSVTTFAYPYGETSPRVRDYVKERYGTACGTRLAHVSIESDSCELPRLDTYYFRDPRWFRRIGRQSGEAYIAARRSARELRSRWSKN